MKSCLLWVNYEAGHVRNHSSLGRLGGLISYLRTKSWQAQHHRPSDGLPSSGQDHWGYQWQGNNRKWWDQSHCSVGSHLMHASTLLCGAAGKQSCPSAALITCNTTGLLCCHHCSRRVKQPCDLSFIITYYTAWCWQQPWPGVNVSYRTHDPPTDMKTLQRWQHTCLWLHRTFIFVTFLWQYL